jgi:hypothetical protein
LPQDNLTLRLKQELERRHGRAVSESEIQGFLRSKGLLGGTPAIQTPKVAQITQPGQAVQPTQTKQFPWSTGDFEEESDIKGGAFNALGVGLWSALDTALFGVPGLAVEEEEFLDFEDPLAKYAGAIGGFAGFVAGAPMKLGAKAVQLAARPFIRKTGRESLETVVRGMKKTGKEAGLDRKTIKEVQGGYRNLVKRSQVDKTLRQEGVLKDKAFDYMNRYIDRGIAEGSLNRAQGDAIKKMFGDNVGRRPLQDFIGLMAERGIAKNSPRLQRVIGHAINDALMFGMIDTVFEGVSTVEDHHFDWTAPMWGVANGIAFSQLGWLNPKGKSAKWFPDFKSGVRAAFGKKPIYARMGSEHLARRVKFMGESLEANGERYIKNVKHGGKEFEINLKSDDILKEFKSKFGDGASNAMISFLESQRKEWGKNMVRWSTRESFENLSQTWMRMAAGGMLFNARTFAEMFMYDYEPDIHDILPHFLIGAWVQRRSNPSRFDLNASRMNRVRQNLHFLGFDTPQLTEIPSFVQPKNRFENRFKDPKMKPIEEILREENIVTDSNEIVETPLAAGEISAMQRPNEMFRAIWDAADGIGLKYRKPLDSISIESQKRVLEAIKKTDPTVKSLDNLVEFWEERNVESTKDFEREFVDIVELIRKADETINVDGARELDIIFDPTSAKNSQVPHYLEVSPELISRARKGELDFLVDADGTTILKGDAAVEKIMDIQGGANRVFDMAEALQQTKRIPDTLEKGKNRAIESEALLRSIYKTITEAEGRINDSFPDNTSYADRFSFINSFNDYATVLVNNTAVRAGQKVVDIFKTDSPNRTKLSGLLEDSGLLILDETTQVYRLRDDYANIKIVKSGEGELSSDEVASAKRTLGKVLALQSYSGGYDKVTEAPPRSIDISKVRALEAYLKDLGYPVADLPGWMHPHMVDFIVRDRVKRTELSIEQVDTMFKLQNHNMSGIEVAVEGKAGGFTVKLIDESVIPPTDSIGRVTWEPYVKRINEYLRKLIKDGKGLVKDGGKVKIVDPAFLSGINMEIPGRTDVSENARVVLTQVLNALPSKFGSFQRQMGEFVRNGNHDIAIRALTAAGVLTNTGKRKGQYQVHIEKFNEQFARQFEKEMNMYGITPEYAERFYAEEAKAARDRFVSEAEAGVFDKNITLQEFYGKYRIDGPETDLRTLDVKDSKEIFDNLVYQPPESAPEGQTIKPMRLLKRDAIKEIMNRMHIQKDGEWKKLTELSSEEQGKRHYGILRDIIGLLSTQRAQESVRVIKYENGRIEQSFETQQVQKLSRYMREVLDVPHFNIDPFATVYEVVDGRYVRTRVENIYRTSENLNRSSRERLESFRNEFEALLSNAQKLHGENTVGENGEIGVKVMVLSPGLNPIGIETRHLTKTENNRIHEQFQRMNTKYGTNEKISESVRSRIREVSESMQNPEVITTASEYEYAIRRLIFENMLTGSDGNKFFVDFLNGTNAEKTMNRIKLYNTKKFVRADDAFLRDVAEGYREIGDAKTDKVIRRIILNEGFGVAMWNDEGYSTVRAEVERMVKKYNIDWDYNTQIGTAHEGASAFDSISYVSRNMMRYVHAIIGHNPNSTNPIKPIISSSGKGAPLLYGKTLFVYAESLDGFFKQNKNVDILTTKSGSKIFNEGAMKEGLDTKMVNKPWQSLTGEARPGMMLGAGKVRNIPIDGIGLMPAKDADITPAKRGQSDYNYQGNRESAETYTRDYKPDLDRNLDKMSFVAKDPIRIREWIMKSTGDEALVPDASAGEGLMAMNNLAYFASLSKFANPMSYSQNMVQNKMFGVYVNSIMNKKRSVTNQFDPDNSHRYGGNAYMVQIPDASMRLNSTLYDSNTGELKRRGEVLLPAHEAAMNLDVLRVDGYETRFVRGKEILELKDVAREIIENSPKVKNPEKEIERTIEAMNQMTLGDVHEVLESMNETFKSGLQVGILVNRKPRTRPNDIALLGLKGFLKKSAGNSIALGSLDVVNVYEGDYDADKADYLFSAERSAFKHANRASHFFVQGVDPTSLQKPSSFHLGMTPGEEGDAVRTMSANADLYKASIGIVQKVPRILGYLSKLGFVDAQDTFTSRLKRRLPDGTEYQPRILLEGDRYRIAIDYENLDFFMRSALETQYIIDGKGQLNENIANDISTWRKDFLFPRYADSMGANEVGAKNRVGFINDMRSQGHSNNKRIRIFRKFDKDGKEVGLNRLDRSIITEMINEYSNLLNSTGNSLFEKTGNQRSPKYTDVMEAADQFSRFNKDINTNLYYRMRRRRIDPTDPKSKKWHEDPDFERRFGVEEKTYKKHNTWGKETGEIGRYFVSTKKVLNNEVYENGVEFSEGRRGAVIDRIVWQLKDADPFNQINTRSATGEMVGMMDRWYNSLMGGTEADYAARTEELIHGIRRATKGEQIADEITYSARTINKKIGFIGNLKRKVVQIGNNKSMTYASRQKAIDKLNNLIREVENEISGYLTKKYKKSRKFKDLKKIKYVSVNEADVKEGTIQYATMSQIQRILPFAGENWGLGGTALKEVSDIKKIRQMFYGNRDNLGDIMQFGPDKTVLDRNTIEFLERMPPISKFQEVEGALLERGINRYGINFLYSFMTPVPDPYSIGVFEGKPVAVPYGATGRYRRGLALLTKIATRREGESIDWYNYAEEMSHGTIEGQELKTTVPDLLRINQHVEAHFNRFFNRKFNMKDFVGDVESVDLDLGIKFKVDQFRLPDFNENLTSMRGIQWARNKKRIGNGFNLMNDHLLDFYTDLMKLSGREKDFDSYLNKMSQLQGDMLGMNVIDPMEYLAMRMQMESEVKKIASDVITGGILQDRSNPNVKKILANPVYALMGGASYFKGLTLETSQPANIKRLRELTKVFKDLESHNEEMNPESRNSRELIEKEKTRCPNI